MANVVVFGAAGKIGSRIVAEAALRKKHNVVAVARDVGRLASVPNGVRAAEGEATSVESIAAFAPEADVLVFAIGGPDKTVYQRAARTAVGVLSRREESAPRVIHVGGGGSLLTPEGRRFYEAPGLPQLLVIEMKGQAAALDVYRASTHVRWTYISPPPGSFEPGQRKGHYRTGLETPVVAEDGTMAISYEDFAIAVLDEVDNNQFIGKRFTVGY